MHLGSLPYKTKQFFLLLIKLSIVVGAFYFIYKKLIEHEELDFHVFLQFLKENNIFSTKTTLFLLFLTLFNWFLEILKWKILVTTIEKISFKNALEQSLGSLTASLFTPNRIGEYGAKAIYYPSGKRKKIVLLNFLGNMMQMSTTIIFGSIGLYLLNSKYELDINYLKVSRFLVVIIVIALFTAFGLKQNNFKIKGVSIERLIAFFKSISAKTKILGLVLSIVRYLVFSFQFYYLLTIFGVNVSYYNAMIVITSMYVLASVIPSVFIFDVVIKSSVAVYLFTIVGVNDFTTLCIITLMWLLNFVLPSLFGSYYVLNFNLSKDTNL
ncbi:lysylphosphatidylglycerol synthase domain-containing protein [Psychroserpens ponticola]|uniref:Lysylphosphatidylglycerol synthase domain-containing protein n=1 Tax=Psychroserpens ponticola TaxID=2932268 RepID=A0ABY7RW58_9FLAO|nr:lysylphosphatidylglycerol synthase domain-containing protein [Psychroserpens ponticola]WCO01344.1 lysylphosphatidylglycerol synthase domain-containing protein [Psychroserpens ponticola]